MPNVLARTMRRRMSDAELRLWVNLRGLRQRGLAFRRQSSLRRYIVDFECRKARLVIEVDGAQHDQADARAYDEARTAWLTAQGYLVLRFWNHDVLRSTDAIVDEILSVAQSRAAARRT